MNLNHYKFLYIFPDDSSFRGLKKNNYLLKNFSLLTVVNITNKKRKNYKKKSPGEKNFPLRSTPLNKLGPRTN